MEFERYVGTKEVAEHLGVCVRTILNYVHGRSACARGIPCTYVGRAYRFKVSEIDNWVANQANRKWYAERRKA